MINEINEFLTQANTNALSYASLEKRMTNNNKDLIGDLLVSISFGQDVSAYVPWISISRYKNYKEDGPVFLYYKSKNKLVLSFGIKEEQTDDEKYNFKWSQETIKELEDMDSFFGEKVFRYNNSYVFKSYDVTNGVLVDGSSLEEDLKEILSIYKSELDNFDLVGFINHNYKDYEERLAQVIQNERQTFIEKYPLEDLKTLSLEQYNKLGDTESFINYVENKTQSICSGSLKRDRNRLFFERNGEFRTLKAYERSHPNKTVTEIFDIFKLNLYNYIKEFDINNYDESILPGRLNIIKFKAIRLYRPELNLYGLPSISYMKEVIKHLKMTDPKKEEVMFYNFMLTEYLKEKDPSLNERNTDIINTLIWEYFNNNIKGISWEDIDEDDDVEENNEGIEEMKKVIDKNLILYGPPGTGKTYNSKNYAVAICEGVSVEDVMKEEYKDVLKRYDDYVSSGRIVFTTFHQSYGYEEFIEGLFPELDKNTNQIIYKIKDGTFKEFCNVNNSSVDFETAWSNLTKDVEEQKLKWGDVIGTAEDQTKDRLLVLNSNGNIIIPYGSGIPFTKESAFKYYNGENVEYASRQGIRYIYEYFARKYYSNLNVGPKVFIIDEINRGNISKIFGELITLIEESKRAGEKEEMNAILPYSKESFSVPNNVHIIGTMNTADRSIALMDTALRRRFSFIEMMPDTSKINVEEVEGLNIKLLLKTINERINVLYDREHTIGHAYFISEEQMKLENLANIFRNKIIPLLQEYFYEDYEKIRWVLGDDDKTDESLEFFLKIKNERNIFKGNIDMNIVPEFRYEINEEAFYNIESYKQII